MASLEQIEVATKAVSDEYGSRLCFDFNGADPVQRFCKRGPRCRCMEIAVAVLNSLERLQRTQLGARKHPRRRMMRSNLDALIRTAEDEVEQTVQAFRDAVTRLKPHLSQREVDELVREALKEPLQS